MNARLAPVELLERLSRSWPVSWQVADSVHALRSPPEDHPLHGEFAALETGDAVCLPFFQETRVGWVTLAGDAERLQEGIDDLRAWILPSFGWEDEERPLALPGEAASQLSNLLFGLSPAGYFRWWCARSNVDTVVERLRTRRALLDAKPLHVVREVASLVELRRQFEVGLAIGGAQVAQTALDTIDRYQLDTARNTRFMQVRLWDRFGEYEEIVNQPGLDDLLALPVPNAIRLAIVRAFHAVFLAELEEAGAIEEAQLAYATRLPLQLGAFLDRPHPGDDVVVRRCMAYRARHATDRAAAAFLLGENGNDSIVRQILALLEEPEPESLTLEERFYRAWQLQNWSGVQALGRSLLERQDELPEETRSEVLLILRHSLRYAPDSTLAERLQTPVPEGTPAAVVEATPSMAADWPEFLARLQQQDWEGAHAFLRQSDRSGADAISSDEVPELVRTVGELFTSPELDSLTAVQLVQESLSLLIEDFVSEPGFPRRALHPLYAELLRVWAEQRVDSTFIPDGQLLLVLAAEVLEHSGDQGGEVTEILSRWWNSRPVRAQLPFLLEALDLLTEFTTPDRAAENLWIQGADLVRRDPDVISRGERILWRQIGRRIGLDPETIDEFLAITEDQAEAATDPIGEAPLQKIAIVSLQERAARQAAEWIRERTSADVLTVVEQSAGAATDSAKTADVILFVWAANKHAVYRAFDDVRDRLAYVQGTGPSSIVLALERWIKQAAVTA
jgi:hypothetical protein